MVTLNTDSKAVPHTGDGNRHNVVDCEPIELRKVKFEIVDPQLAEIRRLVADNELYLPGHPDLGLGHFKYLGGEINRQPVIVDKIPLSEAEIVRRVQTNRDRIEEVAREVTFKVISLLADRLQLDSRYQNLMPTVICSDKVDDKNLWSVGQDDGFYELNGSYFIANLAIPARMDYRVKRIFGPIIHYSTHEGHVENIATVVEESLHYLQWVNELSPETLDKLVKMARELKLPNNGCRPDGSIYLSMFSPKIDPFSQKFQKAYGDDLASIQRERASRSFDERMAGLVLFETAAELLRIEFGVSEEKPLYQSFEKWAENGIPGWTDYSTEHESPEANNQVEDIQQCYQAMTALSWKDFMDTCLARCGAQDWSQVVAMSNMMNLGNDPMSLERAPVFPQDFAHFLGYTLGQELHRSGRFSDAAGLQEASLTFFSYLQQPSVRLRYLIDLLV